MNGKGEKTMGDTKKENDNIIEFGQAMLHADRRNTTIYLLSIIGEIEGHECLPSTSKTTKYEHVLPRLAAIEDDESVNGVLLLLNTMGGDVESGLAIAEMVASLSKPAWWEPFHRCSAGRFHRLFFYCSERNHGDPSGTDEWNRDRGKTDI